jgi:hypothetical protein
MIQLSSLVFWLITTQMAILFGRIVVTMAPPMMFVKVLQSHSNIYCDLSARSKPKLSDWVINKRPQAEIFTSYGLNGSWKDLIEEMPGRFMIGTDTKGGSNYDSSIGAVRNGLLSNLSQETAEKVAYKNAQKLLDLH